MDSVGVGLGVGSGALVGDIESDGVGLGVGSGALVGDMDSVGVGLGVGSGARVGDIECDGVGLGVGSGALVGDMLCDGDGVIVGDGSPFEKVTRRIALFVFWYDESVTQRDPCASTARPSGYVHDDVAHAPSVVPASGDGGPRPSVLVTSPDAGSMLMTCILYPFVAQIVPSASRLS